MELKQLAELIKRDLPKKSMHDVKFIDGFLQDSIVITVPGKKYGAIKVTKTFGWFLVESSNYSNEVIKKLSVRESYSGAHYDISDFVNKNIIIDSEKDMYWVGISATSEGGGLERDTKFFETKKEAKDLFKQIKSAGTVPSDFFEDYENEKWTLEGVSYGYNDESYADKEFNDYVAGSDTED